MSMEQQIKEHLLPQKSWSSFEKIIKGLAEGDEKGASEDDFEFLRDIGFLGPRMLDSELTDLGASYYESRFIREDSEGATEALRAGLLQYPPCEALLQLLFGVKSPRKANALSVLKSRGFWFYTTESPLTNLLLMMNSVGLIRYSKKFKSIDVLYNPSQEGAEIPSSIFIEPTRPYGNKLWLKRVLRECRSYVYWIDKHFTPSALEYLWEAADANNIKKIFILSLALETQVTKKAVREYQDLKKELAVKGINVEWRRIESVFLRDIHDRWILSEGTGWNLPDVNTIMSGHRSEINKSDNHAEVKRAFEGYWKKATEIT